MDDFSQPGQVNSFGYAASEANFIRPGKRPMSSMSPSVVYDRESGKVSAIKRRDHKNCSRKGTFSLSPVSKNSRFHEARKFHS